MNDISVESPEHAKKIIEVMEASADLCVPNKVDYEKGPNWGEIVSDAKKEKK
jgi:DNA polymerase I-like protein with 3'-5' exonuclease and polymerase domains